VSVDKSSLALSVTVTYIYNGKGNSIAANIKGQQRGICTKI